MQPERTIFLSLFLAVVSAFVPVIGKFTEVWAYIFPFLTLILVGFAFLKFRTMKTLGEKAAQRMEGYTHLEFKDVVCGEELPGVLAPMADKVANFAALVSAQLDTLAKQARVLSEVKDFVGDSAEKIMTYAEKTDRFALDMLNSASRTAQDVETLTRALTDLNTAASEIASSIAHTAQKTSEAREKAMQAKETIEKLLESSEKIGSVAQVINDIADQTNLLALNATIEAARAGEAGKGFAVVANEVKELARQTAEATKEITHIIENIRADTSQAVEAVESITGGVLEIDDLANTIASASEEQTATIADITQNIENVKALVENIYQQAETLIKHTKDFGKLRTLLEASRVSVESIALENNMLFSGLVLGDHFFEKAQKCLDEHIHLKIILLKHYEWINEVINGLVLGKPPEVQTDPNLCVLGEFLKSYRPDAKTEPILEELLPLHEELHRSAIEIQKRLAANDREGALSYFEKETLPIFFRTSELFNRWITAVGGRVEEVSLVRKETQEEFMSWGPQFEIGIREIDQQHRKLVSMVNALYGAIKEGKDKEFLGELLNELASYTDYHFKTEEYYFDKFGYPEGEIHKEIHRKLVQKVLDFKEKFDRGEATISYDLLNFLKDWLVNHICKTDKKYGPFLKEKGVK